MFSATTLVTEPNKNHRKDELTMKEPTLRETVFDRKVPYSEAPVEWLQRVVAGTVTIDPDGPDVPTGVDRDAGFRAMYAAILLRERGL